MKTELLVTEWNFLKFRKIYKWPFSVTKTTKLKMFQFKINHNIIYTKDRLKRANITSDDFCYLYKSEQHYNPVHVFKVL